MWKTHCSCWVCNTSTEGRPAECEGGTSCSTYESTGGSPHFHRGTPERNGSFPIGIKCKFPIQWKHPPHRWSGLHFHSTVLGTRTTTIQRANYSKVDGIMMPCPCNPGTHIQETEVRRSGYTVNWRPPSAMYLKKGAGVSRIVTWSISETALSTEGTSGPALASDVTETSSHPPPTSFVNKKQEVTWWRTPVICRTRLSEMCLKNHRGSGGVT